MDKLFGDSRSIAQKPPLDPTSRAFQPKKFIRQALRGISHGDFEGKLVDQVSAEEKKTGEDLKQLIRDNLGIFIDSKEAMSAIYDQDQSLFTGEALQHITDAFKETEEACQTLVDPTMESFQDVQQSRKSQDILEKLYSVLSLPGLLYEYCGVRVAQTKVAETNSQQLSRHSSRIKLNSTLRTGAQAQSSQQGAAPATDVNEDEEEGDEDTDVTSDDGSDSAPRSPVLGFGALEGQLYAVNAAHRFLLYPGEELFFWYGTPLARIKNKDARRLHQDQVANYEGAVLCLRRAMLYMEENYDLEDGTLLAVESFGDGAPEPPASSDGGSVAAAAGAASGGKRKVSAVSRSPFMYKFALALLRSALYLVDQLAVELVLANAADTVLIEDTLSMMMDVSIATVKLFSFCKVLQGVLMSKSDLTGLRDRLVESVDGGDTATTRGAAPFTATATNAATGGNDLHHPASKQQHPAEYFVAITRSQHTRLTIASATSLLREASMWMAKVAPSTAAADTQPKDAATAGDDGNTPFNPTAISRGEAFTFSDVILGNINDSFVGNTNRSSGAATVDQDELDTSVSMSLQGKQLQVGGFSVEQSAKSPIAVVEVQNRVESVLAAFQTPEIQFPSYTSFTIGTIDMADILESSCMQMLMHARNMLLQLSERADTETTVMAQGALLNTFAARLSEACMTNLEHVMVSYLGGIAATIHAGVFDFAPNPNSSLARMLQDVVASASPVAPQKPAGSAVSAFPSRAGSFAFQPAEDRAPPDATAAADPASPLIPRAEKLPELKFVPVLPDTQQLHNSSMMSSSTGSSLVAPVTSQRMTLRDLSVGAVRRMVRSASIIMYSLFIAFVNRSVVSGFVRRMALYTVGDLTLHSKDEVLELHAAILVEVMVGQWERVMTQVSDSVLRMKVAVGESCSTGTIKTEQQMKEMGELLSDLEQLRSSCFRCYIHGVGMLSKAYVTLFPMIQPGGGTVLEHRVRARLSRDFVSSPSTSKLLNLFSVVMDRTIPFLMRHIEVYDSADLFAAKEEDLETPEMALQAGGARGAAAVDGGSSRRRVLRRRQNPRRPDAGSPMASADETAVRSDPITQLVASAHARLVQEHLEEHEELLQALLSNLMLSFIDMLHVKCHSVTGNHHLELGDRERDMMECMADALCLPTTVAPILLDHLLHPSLFVPTAALRTQSPGEAAALVRAKYNAFQQQYLPRVGEHCQLAVDAMVNMYLAIPQQQITREVRQGGFMLPLFDWQRVTAHTCAAVRPYIAQCLIIVAQSHEALHWIHQPALAAAVTQRLIGHLASTLATAISVDINAFEVSLECSHDFLLYGLLLIEAEAQTVLAVVQSILESIAKNSAIVGDVLPEVLLSRDCLQGVLQALWQQDTVACEAISAARATAAAATADGAKSESVYAAPLSRAERVARRETMTQAALEHLSYMVAAINTHLEEVPPACGLQRVSNEATQNIAERLAKRKEGYMGQMALRAERAMKKAKEKEEGAKQKRESEKEKEKGGRSKRSTRQPVAQLVDPPQAPTPPAAVSPTEASGPVDLTATLYQHAVDQETQQRKRVLRLRPERDTASPAAAATAPAVSPAMPTPEAPSPQLAAEEEAIPQRRPRRQHVTVVQPGEASGAPPPTRDRRANRFKRSNVV